MRQSYILLLAALVLMFSCSKKEEENKCQNGGDQVLDFCICPDGYFGSECEIPIYQSITRTFYGAFYIGSGQYDTARLVVTRHPNNDPRSLQIFRLDSNNNKTYITDTRLTKENKLYSVHTVDSGIIITISGNMTTEPFERLSFSITRRPATGGSTESISYTGYPED